MIVFLNFIELLRRAARQRRQRETLRELEGLSDHTLRDIGLNRADLECAVRRGLA